jgi:hypothetical protein
MICYIAHYKPFLWSYYNYSEIMNEGSILVLGIMQQSFIIGLRTPDIKFKYGMIYIVIWLLILVGNFFFVLYFSFYLNFQLSKTYVERRNEIIKQHDDMVKDIDFKKMLVTENKLNFMIQHEINYAETYLTNNKVNHDLKYKREFMKREIEWLRRNNLPIKDVYPNYKEPETIQMYRLGKKRDDPTPPAPPTPRDKPEAAHQIVPLIQKK